MAIYSEDVTTRLRFLLGNPSEGIIDDCILIGIVDSCIITLGDNGDDYCKVLQCSLMETLRFLIRQAQIPSSPDGSEVKRRKEKRGNTEIELEFQSTTNSDTSTGWQSMYEDYQSHPEWICEELVSSTSGKYLVNIGGSRVDDTMRVLKDPNSNSAYNKSRVSRKFWNTARRNRINTRRRS